MVDIAFWTHILRDLGIEAHEAYAKGYEHPELEKQMKYYEEHPDSEEARKWHAAKEQREKLNYRMVNDELDSTRRNHFISFAGLFPIGFLSFECNMFSFSYPAVELYVFNYKFYLKNLPYTSTLTISFFFILTPVMKLRSFAGGVNQMEKRKFVVCICENCKFSLPAKDGADIPGYICTEEMRLGIYSTKIWSWKKEPIVHRNLTNCKRYIYYPMVAGAKQASGRSYSTLEFGTYVNKGVDY